MASQQPLHGLDLVDCAKANAKQGTAVAAQQCGYGQDLEQFMENLKQACQDIGVEIQELRELIVEPPNFSAHQGIDIAPDTDTQL